MHCGSVFFDYSFPQMEFARTIVKHSLRMITDIFHLYIVYYYYFSNIMKQAFTVKRYTIPLAKLSCSRLVQGLMSCTKVIYRSISLTRVDLLHKIKLAAEGQIQCLQ